MFTIDKTAQALSDSESDCEIPKFEISAFKKFGTAQSDIPKDNKKAENFHNKSIELSSSLQAGDRYNKCTYVCIDHAAGNLQSRPLPQNILMKEVQDENLKKNFLSRKTIKKIGRKEREKTKGYNWFDMPAPEMTEEKKNDLLVVQMRQALDPKHFYKRSANKSNPKYFQVGTFVESPIEFYSSRVPKKQRKQTLVDELLADSDFRQYQKKKYSEIQQIKPGKFGQKRKKKSKLAEARASRSTVSKQKKNKRKA